MATTKTIQATVKNRTDTAANWTQKNPVLAEGEIIVVQTSAGETRLKIGDGVKTFTQLPYTDEQIYNNVVTSVNGQTGDVTLDVSGGAGTLVQSDWNQNDETASDYIKNRPGGYSKQVSINIDTDITAGMEGLISDGENFLYRLPIDNINDLRGAKIGKTQNDAVTVDSIIFSKGNDKVKTFLGLSDSKAVVAAFFVVKEDNTALDDNNTIIANKGIYTFVDAVGGHIYINNNGTVRCPIDASLLPINSTSDYIGVYQSECGTQLDWNLEFDKRQFTFNHDPNDGHPILYIGPLYKAGTGIAISDDKVISGAYKAGNGISISDDGTISVTTATYYTGTTDPVNTLGADGDLYLKTEG